MDEQVIQIENMPVHLSTCLGTCKKMIGSLDLISRLSALSDDMVSCRDSASAG